MLYSNAMGGVRLQAHANRAEQATRVLAEEDPFDTASDLREASVSGSEDLPGAPAPSCAQCGGELGPTATHGRRPAFLTWLLLGWPLWPLRRRQTCLQCGQSSPGG